MWLSRQLAILAMAVAVAVGAPPAAPGPPASSGTPELVPDVPVAAALSDQLPMEARDSDLSLEPDLPDAPEAPAALVSPPAILNGGKPFFVDKDPVTGKLDFSATKAEPAEPPPQDPGLSSAADYDYEEHDGIDRKDTAGTRGRPNDLSSPLKIVTPNFHDFLNLPVKYSSAGDKYPLISSSYANTKVQGMGASSSANTAPSGSIKNHKPYSSSTAPAPHYYTLPTTSATSTATSTSLAPSTTTTTTTTTTTSTTPRPVTRRPMTSTPTPPTTTKKPLSFWGLLSSEEYPDEAEAPQGSFGMRPPKVPASSEERPDYEYVYEDDAPPQQPPQPVMSSTAAPTSPPSTTSTTTTTTTTTTTVRPTTRRPQLSTVMILKPFNRKPVVVTARPAEPSTTSTTTTSTTTPSTTTPSTTTPSTTTSTTSTMPPTRIPSTTASTTTSPPTSTTANVVIIPEKTAAASNKVVFEQSPPSRPAAPRPQRPLAPHPGRPQQGPPQGPPQGPLLAPPQGGLMAPPRDSPYGMSATQPFRPLYRPPPPSGPSGYGDLITAPLAGDSADSNYVSFSF